MLHSYGDSELVCGLDSTGSTGAWRSPRGMLAITKTLGSVGFVLRSLGKQAIL